MAGTSADPPVSPPAAADTGAADPGSAVGLALRLAPGTLLGAYRVQRLLGAGGVGAVYEALDRRDGRLRALKVLALDAADHDTRSRFLREIASAQRLRHPAIVEVIDAGQTGPLGWLAMERAAGHDLQRHGVAGQLLPAAGVARIGAAVAAALAHAHRQGVLHRDLKPSNILFNAATARVQLTDFGIARIVGEGAADITRSGLLVGTVAFMSPEQLTGAPVGAASDFYSLGVTLYLLLSGQLPHAAPSMSQQMHDIVNRPPPDLLALRPELPAPLTRTVARLLAKSPAERCGHRPGDGDALAAELRGMAVAMAAEAARGDRAAAATPAPLSGALPAVADEAPVDPRHNSSPELVADFNPSPPAHRRLDPRR